MNGCMYIRTYVCMYVSTFKDDLVAVDGIEIV